MTKFAPAAAGDRDHATRFVGRVAQLDPAAMVRLVARGEQVELWARGGFGVIATTTVSGLIEPDPMTVYATNLVAALAVSRAAVVDAGTDVPQEWHSQLPPATGWEGVGTLRVADIVPEVRAATLVAEQAVEIDRVDEFRAKTKATVPPAVLDRPLMTVADAGLRIPISMRMLFALSGMGFVDDSDGDDIRVSVTKTWLRLDAPTGSVARRRMADLPLAAGH